MKHTLFNFFYYLARSFKATSHEFKEGLVFPMTYKRGVRLRFDLVKLGRKILNKKWKYLFITYGLISVIGFGYMYNRLTKIEAASYGFEQVTWSEANTGAVALHDVDQEDYYKYYSKDSNIDLSNSSEIRLFNMSSTIIETNSSDFINGTYNSHLYTDNNEIKIHPCLGGNTSNGVLGEHEGLNYCVLTGQLYTECAEWSQDVIAKLIDYGVTTSPRVANQTDAFALRECSGGGPWAYVLFDYATSCRVAEGYQCRLTSMSCAGITYAACTVVWE